MAWPDYIKPGEFVSAAEFVAAIIERCKTRLNDPQLDDIQKRYYELILGHALLERDNHAHGLLRTFVSAAGGNAGQGTTKIDQAWTHVREAYQKLLVPSPTLADLAAALNGIDHGGGG